MLTCAKFVSNKLKDAGMTKLKSFQQKDNHLFMVSGFKAPEKPTVLIYGHYDVQPVDPIKLWNSDPFEPVVKGGKIWARGANDNKGQNFVHIKSVEAFMKHKEASSKC